MSEPREASSSDLASLLKGYRFPQLIYVAAKLCLADLVRDAPRTPEELAQQIAVDPFALRLVIDALVRLGVFLKNGNGTISSTPTSEQLVRGNALWHTALLCGELYYRGFGGLLTAVQTGTSAFEATFGMPIFTYLDQHSDVAEHFYVHIQGNEEAILSAYDFSSSQLVIDIGGGDGRLLSCILQTYPHLEAVLFELPSAVKKAQQTLEAVGLLERCRLHTGDFFVDALPREGDIYILTRIIHDWDDERALHLLRRCHQAMPASSRLLLIERVAVPQQTTDQDLFIWAMTGGRERSADQFRTLLACAGFEIVRIQPTQSKRSIIEALPQRMETPA
jgi:hypothetical protein